MIYNFNESKIKGVYELTPPVFNDERGSISKIFHRESFEELGIDCSFNETLVTKNYRKGVIRGFHFQNPPYAQSKTLFASKGSFLNIVFDIRTASDTYGEFDVFEMCEIKSNILYVPAGVANCYCISKDDTTIIYNLTSKYMPDYSYGFRYDSIDYKYPFENPVLSEKDLILPYFKNYKSPF